MDNFTCSYCGSKNLIWDYTRGEVVCGDCGTTVDRVYDYRPMFMEEVLRSSQNRSLLYKNREIESFKEFMHLLKKSRFLRKYKGVKLNVSLNQGSIQGSKIYSQISLDALYKIESDKVAIKIYKYLEKMGIFSGLKFKTRVLLTYYLVYDNDKIRIKRILKTYYSSEENIKRIIKQIPFNVRLEIMRMVEESKIKN
ncbi:MULTISPECIES: TFIIB-type zinc ribbon-containing protein [Metallosphaera]|uniref:TFIIB-type zinc ribbon-containing protein n=1 Tax=Metallosphaera TaxID=41980 RepID=UPI0023DA3C4B|nr:TFIIB-type zinc ribbon-containing protein [Metallosphaera sedula]